MNKCMMTCAKPLKAIRTGKRLATLSQRLDVMQLQSAAAIAGEVG
jgi:hypothetical protein